MANVKITDEMIREAAYYIWDKEGRQHGMDFEHWVRAYNELAAASSKESKSAEVKKPAAAPAAKPAAEVKKPAPAAAKKKK